jgi:hypothetical protein
MSDWKYTLHVRHIIKNQELSSQESSKRMAKSLQRFCVKHPILEPGFDLIITEFTELSTLDLDQSEVTKFFDQALNDLYDLCDFYRIWIPFVK